MKQFFLERQLSRIEQEGNDDFLQILTFGANYYPTPELQALLRQLDERTQQLAHARRLILLIGASTTLWIAFSFLFQSLDFTLGVYFTLAMVPLTIIAFTIGNVMINKRYKAVRDARLIEKIIVEELDRRRKDASIF
ncbi:hypothetical protein [Phaeodactylibacter luteus]|uniref:Uncharacterized protein n=1 Tax=Phaeodactylibacter luteus TaxID=1564516 RepID=A0A5C6RSW5_9BACT|nr:hypothetical protein [Phaeodactylibacter luteus]TXB65536.1 hypothetical protein FRY97_06025 [Phaeodactylibacter luteus]